MNRRSFLVASSVLSVASLAGCTGGTEGTGANGDGSSSNQDPEQAQEHLDAAGTALENAGDEINEESAKFEDSEFQGGGVDIETAATNEYLDTASNELDQAEELANDDQLERIEAGRRFIEFAREFVSFLDVFADGYSEAYAGFTYFQSERYEDAVTELEAAEGTLSDAEDRLTVTQTRLDDIPRDTFDDIDAVQLTKVETALGTLEEMLPPIQALVVGMRHTSEGMLDYMEAMSFYDREQYGQAESSFRAASEDFASARSTFVEEEDSAPSEVKSTMIEMTCIAGAMRDGNRHLANSMEAYENQNYDRAESEANDAQDAFNRCSS